MKKTGEGEEKGERILVQKRRNEENEKVFIYIFISIEEKRGEKEKGFEKMKKFILLCGVYYIYI